MNPLPFFEALLARVERNYVAPPFLDFEPSYDGTGSPSLPPTTNNRPFTSYRSALLTIKENTSRLVVPPDLVPRLTALRNVLSSCLQSLDDSAKTTYVCC
ncbi:hypothetical protein FRC19_007344 [Serendipita sp. 401]|nr:hypothetical protein FRC19_007344 [Serendipita sp. 401]